MQSVEFPVVEVLIDKANYSVHLREGECTAKAVHPSLSLLFYMFYLEVNFISSITFTVTRIKNPILKSLTRMAFGVNF